MRLSIERVPIETMRTMFMMMMLLGVSALSVNGHVCNSGWSAYVPSYTSHSFAVAGCDAVYDELIKQAFPASNCSFLTVLEKDAVCMTTKDDLEHSATCRSPGVYGFDAMVVVKCPSGIERWSTAVMGTMKKGVITLNEDMEHFPVAWTAPI